MSVIQAGNTTTTSLIYTGDTTGNLVFTTGGANTVALTIDSTQNITTTQRFAAASMPTGSILQVVSATKTDTSSTSSSTFSDVSGLSVTITPKFSTSKILIIATINIAWQNATAKGAARLVRNSTPIAIGDSAGTRISTTGFTYVPADNYSPFSISANYLDSPSTTSSTTYKWQFSSLDNAGTIYVNRGYNDPDTPIQGRSASFLTVMEIAA